MSGYDSPPWVPAEQHDGRRCNARTRRPVHVRRSRQAIRPCRAQLAGIAHAIFLSPRRRFAARLTTRNGMASHARWCLGTVMCQSGRQSETMCEESEMLPPETAAKFGAWIRAWFEQAVTDGFICRTHEFDEAIAKRLHGYFDVGLTPCDGVFAYFGMVH